MNTTRTIDKLVVHSSGTPSGRPVTTADIDHWHRKRGYRRIGFHYVIYVDGSVHPGRPEEEPGIGHGVDNKTAIGICLVGGVDGKGKPSPLYASVQLTALRKLLADLRVRYPKGQITGTPGFDLSVWIATGKAQA